MRRAIWNPFGPGNVLRAALLIAVVSTPLFAEPPAPEKNPVQLRIGGGMSIVDIQWGPAALDNVTAQGNNIHPHPRPRLAGYLPLAAVVTSDQKRILDENTDNLWEHDVRMSYVGNTLNPPANLNYIVGVVDSGAVVDLVAGPSANTLGLTGPNLTENTIPLTGVGGSEILASVTFPIGYFAAGLGAVNEFGFLDTGQLKGHSNVCAVVSPPIGCGEEVVRGLIGTPFLAFFTTVIRVDMPRRLTHMGESFISPDVRFQTFFDPIPEIAHQAAMQFVGLVPATTASWFPAIDEVIDDIPGFPTQLSFFAGTIPTGGLFFSNVRMAHGNIGPGMFLQQFSLMVDTGAQASIISRRVASELSLPLQPDFTVSVCGIGGLQPDVPGYYVDYVQIGALGGALEFSRAPFIVIDLPSPDGTTMDGILGTNFFWNRNMVFEPTVLLGASSIFSLSSPISFSFGDDDADMRVDHRDHRAFQACLAGPQPNLIGPQCNHLDGDLDLDVDLKDFAAFQNCFRGTAPADPNCGPS